LFNGSELFDIFSLLWLLGVRAFEIVIGGEYENLEPAIG
jgi:hypothetical protein